MRNPAAHGGEIGTIGQDEGGSVMAAEEIIEFAFPLLHAFGTAKPFEMRLTDIGDDAMGGEGILAIPFNFFLVVRAHFDDGELRVAADREDGKRDADMVVEIPPGGIGCERRGQHGVDQFLCGGLAVAAGNGDEGDVELAAVVEGKLLEGVEDVGDENELVAGIGWEEVEGLARGFVDDGIGGAEFQGAPGEQVAVEVGSFESEEKITRL